ncbi:DnaJ- protein scj1 [Xylographa carneopallida]|nr:DnaJ- protein scj1 [Xylographa carneopallida]
MPIARTTDYYAVLEIKQSATAEEIKQAYLCCLEIKQSATAEEIKQAYRRLSLARHPDKNPNSSTAHHTFCTLNEAYETLGDANRRVLYNAEYPGIRAKHASEAQERKERESARAAAEHVRVAADSARREREQWQDLQRKRAEVTRIERAGLTPARDSAKACQRENQKGTAHANAQLKIMRESEVKFKALEQKALREQRLREDAIRIRVAEEKVREGATKRKRREELAARVMEEQKRQQEEWLAKAKAAEQARN